MALALRAWAINRRGKNSVRNLQYGPRTRLVRGMYGPALLGESLDVKERMRECQWKGLGNFSLNFVAWEMCYTGSCLILTRLQL